MSVEIDYYDGSQWVDITGLAKSFTVTNEGIRRVPSATVVLHSNYASLLPLLTAHNKYIRILIDPSGANNYRIFYGRIWHPHGKGEPGTNKTELTLDCNHIAQRLADDYISFDYYKMQSATTPALPAAWTYRSMIADFLSLPDSGYDTGFAVQASSGLVDYAIDRSCTFERQTLLDALRTVCERIGYNGFFELDSATPTAFLYGLGGLPVAGNFSDPFLASEWDAGSLDDVANYILVHGGVDIGVPSDGDRWTEKGVAKYSPAAWTASATVGTMTVIDVINSLFTKDGIDYGVNDYCVKATNNSTQYNINFYLNIDLTKTVEGEVDCKNRCTKMVFRFAPLNNSSDYRYVEVEILLEDDAGTKIMYKPTSQETGNFWLFFVDDFAGGKVYQKEIPVGGEIKPLGNSDYERWAYIAGSNFHWDHVRKVTFEVWRPQYGTGNEWGIEVDGLQFVGGYSIDPFAEYAAILNPPVQDATSISQYGVHVNHLQDTLINTFEYAQNEGHRVLDNLKNPVGQLTFRIPANSTLINPASPINVTAPQWNLNATTMRVLKTKYEWTSTVKRIYQTITCTSQTSPTPPIWTELHELRPLIK